MVYLVHEDNVFKLHICFCFHFVVADQVSSVFWLLHSDLHQDRVTAAFEYISSMMASVEPLNQYAAGQRGNMPTLPLLEQNSAKGKFHVRFKRRNGRVRVAVISLSLSLSPFMCMCHVLVLKFYTDFLSGNLI